MFKVLDDNNADGVSLGQNAAAKISLYGTPPVPQRSVPMQASIQGLGSGQVLMVCFAATPNVLGIPTQMAWESIAGITPEGGFVNVCVTADFLMGIVKPSVGTVGIGGVRITGTNAFAMHFVNALAGAAGYTPINEVNYVGLFASGIPFSQQVITPVAVTGLASSEQIFTIQGSGAAGTAIISGGQVIGVNITAGGTGYVVPPSVTFAGGGPLGGVTGPQSGSTGAPIGGSPWNASQFQATNAGNVSGTFTGLDYPPATAAYPYGSGACGIAAIQNGAVVGVCITSPGSGYQIAPAVTFTGGNTFSPGMFAHLNKSVGYTGLAVGNVRVAGPYQVGVTFLNVTTAPITPAGETYSFLVTNEYPAIANPIEYVWSAGTPVMALLGAVSATFAEVSVTLPGILSTDMVIGVQHTATFSATVPGFANAHVVAASVLAVDFVAGNAAATLIQLDNWMATIWRKNPVAPTTLLYPYMAPATVITPNGVWEVPMTVTGIAAGTCALVNKTSHTQGIGIVNSRVSAANTLQVSYANLTAAAISLSPEFYVVEVFNQVPPWVSGQIPNWVIQQINPSFNQDIDLANETRDALDQVGLTKGY